MREIHKAVREGDLKKLREVIAIKVQRERRYAIDVLDDDGFSALHLACYLKNLPMVQCLVQAGANVNLPYSDGGLALVGVCSEKGTLALVQCLVEAGANVNVAALRTSNSPFLLACSWGHLDIVRYLFPKVNNLEAINKAGETALAVACSGSKKLDVIKFLLEKGAKPENVIPSVYGAATPDIRYMLDSARNPSSGAVPRQQAYIAPPAPVYSTPAAQYSLYPPAPQQNNSYAKNMNATANVLNAIANVEQGTADLYGAFNNNSGY